MRVVEIVTSAIGCLVALAGLPALSGCGAWGMDRDLYDAVHRADAASPEAGRPQLGQPGPAGPAAETGSQPASSNPQSPAADLPAQPTVEDYVHVALARNPGIQAAWQKVQRLSQRVVQEASLDDPMFMVAPVGRMPENANAMFQLRQTFPTPGKLNARARIAAREMDMAAADFDKARLAVEADARTAFWNYYYADAALRITESDRTVLKQIRDTADARFRAGSAEQADVLRGNVELSSLDNELLTLRQDRQRAAGMLNSLMDRPVTVALPPPGEVGSNLAAYDLDPLLAAAAERNPELAGIKQRIEMFRQQLRLARLRRVPDLTVGLNYNSMPNMVDEWWLQFEFNIPIWMDKLRAGEREARAGILEASSEYGDAKNRVMFRVQDALIRVQTQQRLVLLLRDVIIPQARQTLAASMSSYRAGKTDFSMLSDSRRKLLDYQLMYQRSLAQLGKDLADLAREIGGALPPAAAAEKTSTTQPEN